MITDAVLFDEGDHLRWGEAGERGLGKVGVPREKVFGFAVNVGEVTAATTGDEDLFSGAFSVFDEDDVSAAAAGLQGAHHAGGSSAQYSYIDSLHVRSPLRSLIEF